MKILVTGCRGQLGLSIQKIHNDYQQYTFYFTDIPEMDITNYSSVNKFIKYNNINLIINCAAYTAVDKAEKEPDIAHKINCTGAEILSKVTKENNINLIHISTDYVFDGESCHPLKETDEPNPISIYGSTKLAGEQAIINSGCKAIIIRTAWLYSEFGKNFVKTMLKIAQEKTSVNVVYDQIGTPTYATDLANAIMKIADRNNDSFELYHFSDEGVISWYDFSKAIFDIAGINLEVNAIDSDLLTTKRPAYSVLSKEKIKKCGITVPYWRDSLIKCISILIQ